LGAKIDQLKFGGLKSSNYEIYGVKIKQLLNTHLRGEKGINLCEIWKAKSAFKPIIYRFFLVLHTHLRARITVIMSIFYLG
jgi:hypothetical protein